MFWAVNVLPERLLISHPTPEKSKSAFGIHCFKRQKEDGFLKESITEWRTSKIFNLRANHIKKEHSNNKFQDFIILFFSILVITQKDLCCDDKPKTTLKRFVSVFLGKVSAPMDFNEFLSKSFCKLWFLGYSWLGIY